MVRVEHEHSTERGAILSYVLDILREVTADWDIDEISAETRLGDLGLESISLVYLIAEVQHYYNLQDLLFQKLRTAAINIKDVRVADVVDFVCEVLATLRVGAGGGRA